MSSALHLVATGLRTVALGVHVFCAPAALTLLFMAVGSGELAVPLFIGIAVLGVCIASGGRCYLLFTPSQWPVLRARVRSAVILDTVGLAGTSVFALQQFFAGRLPVEVGWVAGGLSLLALFAGRTLFLSSLHALASILGRPELTLLVRVAILWSTVFVAIATGFGFALVTVPDLRTTLGLTVLVTGGIWWLLYARALNRLAAVVAEFRFPENADDPDREYRRRYPNADDEAET